jgi:hypothetical protein
MPTPATERRLNLRFMHQYAPIENYASTIDIIDAYATRGSAVSSDSNQTTCKVYSELEDDFT